MRPKTSLPLSATSSPLQEQVAQLTAPTKSCLSSSEQESARRLRSPRVSEAADPSAPGGVWGRSATESRRLPDEVTEPLVEVAVAEDTGCGGRLELRECAYATDIPIPSPAYRGRYVGAGPAVWRSDASRDQYGASAHRVGRRGGGGPRAPSGRSGTEGSRWLRALTGVELSQGAAKTRCDVPGVQWGMTAAGSVRELVDRMASGGRPAFLMAER